MNKQEKGITMIMMVITVVMMIIIASFSILNSRDTIVETKLAKVYAEMKEVKAAVTRYKVLDESMEIFSGDRLENLDAYPWISGDVNQDYYLLDFNTAGNVLCDILEVRNIENNYITNAKELNNIEIFLVNGITIDGETYYSDDEIIEKYNDIFAGREN